MRLYHGKLCGVSDIGGHLGITNAAASMMVDRLVQMGLLERNEDRQDRRLRHLKLTEQGQALVERGIDSPARLDGVADQQPDPRTAGDDRRGAQHADRGGQKIGKLNCI